MFGAVGRQEGSDKGFGETYEDEEKKIRKTVGGNLGDSFKRTTFLYNVPEEDEDGDDGDDGDDVDMYSPAQLRSSGRAPLSA
jgi:hypothetical protein